MARRVTAAAAVELAQLAAEHGRLTPALVLDRGSDPSSALHPMFTWDDTEAARLRRLDEARAIIVQVRVSITPQPDAAPIRVRAYASLGSDRAQGGGYRPIEVVLRDADARGELLRTALGELNALRRKYAHLDELARLFAALDDVGVERQAG